MPAVYPGRWTRGRIIDHALQKTGNTKIKGLAREQLNRLLEDIYVAYEWPFLYAVTPITLSGSATPLPPDYLKSESDDTGLRLTESDQPILQTSPAQFGRKATPATATGTPRMWFHDLANNTAVVWPIPDIPVTATLVYKFLPPDKSTEFTTGAATTADYDADIPLFPYSSLLVLGMEGWAREYERDFSGAQVIGARLQSGLDFARNAAMPRQSQDDVLPLDESTFSPTTFRDSEG